MSSSLKRALIESKLKRLLREADSKITAGDFEKQLATLKTLDKNALSDARAGADLSFQSNDGKYWYVAGAGLTTDQLGNILSDSGKAKLKKAGTSQGAQLNLEPGDFIEPAKATNFRKDGEGGTWTDNTPVPISALRKYFFGAGAGGDVATEGSPTAGKDLVLRDSEMTFVVSTDSLKFMAPNDIAATNPLEAAKVLLESAGFATRYGIPNRNPPGSLITDLNLESPATLDLYIDSLKQSGKIKDAVSSIRTGVGKFADLFSRDDIKVKFAVTEAGPALIRADVVGRGVTAIIGKDKEKLEKTGYFRYEDLPPMRGAKYKLEKGTGIIEVFGNGGVEGVPGAVEGGPQLGNNFASALWLYIRGEIKIVEEQASTGPGPGPGPAPAPSDKDPWEKYKEDEGITPGKWLVVKSDGKPGGVFFDFNQVGDEKPDPANFYKLAKDKLDKAIKMYNSLFPNKQVNSDNLGFSVISIATGDPIGSDEQNQKVAGGRLAGFEQKIKIDNADIFASKNVDEAPWKGTKIASLDRPNVDTKQKVKYARFATAYFDSPTPGLSASDKAKEFYSAVKADGSPDLEESLVREIRRIIRSTR